MTYKKGIQQAQKANRESQLKKEASSDNAHSSKKAHRHKGSVHQVNDPDDSSGSELDHVLSLDMHNMDTKKALVISYLSHLL